MKKEIIKYETPMIEFISFETEKHMMTEFFTTNPNEGDGGWRQGLLWRISIYAGR